MREQRKIVPRFNEQDSLRCRSNPLILIILKLPLHLRRVHHYYGNFPLTLIAFWRLQRLDHWNMEKHVFRCIIFFLYIDNNLNYRYTQMNTSHELIFARLMSARRLFFFDVFPTNWKIILIRIGSHKLSSIRDCLWNKLSDYGEKVTSVHVNFTIESSYAKTTPSSDQFHRRVKEYWKK